MGWLKLKVHILTSAGGDGEKSEHKVDLFWNDLPPPTPAGLPQPAFWFC
jgi:hypothetical protein